MCVREWGERTGQELGNLRVGRGGGGGGAGADRSAHTSSGGMGIFHEEAERRHCVGP